MDTEPLISGQTAPKAKGHRLWMPSILVVLVCAGIAFIQLQPELEQNFKSWLKFGIILLGILLGFVWFLLFSRLNGRLRLAAFLLALLSIFGLTKVLRVDGTIDGSGRPKLVWRWSESRAKAFDRLPAVVSSNAPVQETSLPQVTDVPQFFGPNRDGIIKGAKLVRDWNKLPPKELWRQPVGAGWSSFAVVHGRAFTQEQRGEGECVTCYDLFTGRLIWAHTNSVHFRQWQGGDGPRATPTVDQDRIFSVGATGLLDCLDVETGRSLWSRDVLGENKLPNLIWGISDSPLVFEDTVVVTGGLTNGSTVLSYRRSDGKPLWQAGTDKASYASPVLARLLGKRMVLSCNAASLTAHDPATGQVQFTYTWSDDKWPKASQPVALDGDRVFLSAGYGTGCVLLGVKAESNGIFVVQPLWKNLRMKTQFNSVAARDGFIYGLDDGLLACVELATGERKWKDGHYGSGQTLLVDDLVLIQSESGEVALAEAHPDGFREFGRISALHDKTWNHPTLAGKYLLVRNSREMACFELPVENGF